MNKPSHPRKYETLWKRIRERECVTVKCHVNSMPTIRHGVIKEKWRDEGFKASTLLEQFFLEISWKVVVNFESVDAEQHKVGELTFLLKTRLGLEELIR